MSVATKRPTKIDFYAQFRQYGAFPWVDLWLCKKAGAPSSALAYGKMFLDDARALCDHFNKTGIKTVWEDRAIEPPREHPGWRPGWSPVPRWGARGPDGQIIEDCRFPSMIEQANTR